jgi:NADH pyrophosphatase NudC (nudix superfamily)
MQRCKAALYKIGYPIMRVYWFFRRPTTEGVRCIIAHNNKILLVTHTYGSSLWTAVGGGVEKYETPPAAVIREVSEEVGLTLESVTQVGSIPYGKEYKKDTIHVFVAIAADDTLTVDHSEIKEAVWYHQDNLPPGTSPLFLSFLKLAKPLL